VSAQREGVHDQERESVRTRQRQQVRALAVLLLLIVAAVVVGTLAHTPAKSGDLEALGSATRVIALAALGVCSVISIVVLTLQIAGLRRSREQAHARKPSAPPMSRLAKIVMMLVALALGAGVVALIVFVVPHGSDASRPPARVLPTLAPQGPEQTQKAAHSGSSSDLIIAGIVVVVVLAGLGYFAYRSSRPLPPFDDGDEDENAVERARLSAAIDDAGQALAAETTPRAAIIACYRSMQSSLAAAGVERTAADTPEELLERAARTGLVLPAAADQLTVLFREARFSLHPISEAQRAQAAAALARLRDALAVS
jgi:flagellar basal body-associated protein FliL